VQEISVVIPTYNSGQFIGDAIQSVLDQSIGVREINAVDDGLTDDTAEVVGSFGDRSGIYKQGDAGFIAFLTLTYQTLSQLTDNK
jgi:glycosyltransferase involved in cell wall biosynthesis